MIHYISHFDPAWCNENNVADALRHHGYPPTCYHFPNPLDRPGRNGKPDIKPNDIVFTSIPSRFPLPELRSYKFQGAHLVCWNFDWIWKLGNRPVLYTPRLRMMDVIFSTDGTCGREYIRRGMHCRIYLPQGAAPMATLPTPTPGTPKHDVVFMGHLYSRDRQELARRLSARWDFANLGAGERIWGRAMSDICQSTSIMIGTNYRNDIPGYWSDRPYVVMGAGGFYLGHHVRGFDNHFKHGVHYGRFEGMHDMEVQVAYWLCHPAEREACRLRGHALVQEQHTYTNRVGRLLAALRLRGFLK